MSVFRSRFFWKIYSTFSLLFLCNTLIVSWIVSYKVQSTISTNLMDNLKAKAEFLVPHAKEVLLGRPLASEPEMIHALGAATGTRVTFIRSGGEVVEDSDKAAQEMENHWQRPEVQTALTEPYGVAERTSATIKKNLVYLAKAIKADDGSVMGVVRVSLPVDKIKGDLASLQMTLTAIAIAGVMLALAIGWTLAKRVAIPIREMVLVAESMRAGKYERKVQNLTDDELGRLGDTLNRLGAELTSKITELQRLENVRRDFVANVSHEIKTPLTSIKGYVETLLAGAIDEPEHRVRFLDKIQRNAERLANLVSDLLSLAKIEAGEDSFQPQPVELTGVVSAVVARHEDAVTKKHLKLEVQAPQAPLMVMGDKEALNQVLDNLLTNAIKYTPDGGTITVNVGTKAPWGRIEVADTGIGIPTEHLDRIFERFYRVDKARSRELGGTGLGLSIVKHLVSGMHGEVGVESKVGVGSRFTVRLKLAA